MKLADRTPPSAWKPCETPSHSVLSVRRRTRHAAFGLATNEQNLANPTAQPADHIFGFTGRETDEESDLNFYRARYYDPSVARFISQDPIGFDAGDANLYRYVGNGPTNATDPSGLQSPPNSLIGTGSGYYDFRSNPNPQSHIRSGITPDDYKFEHAVGSPTLKNIAGGCVGYGQPTVSPSGGAMGHATQSPSTHSFSVEHGILGGGIPELGLIGGGGQCNSVDSSVDEHAGGTRLYLTNQYPGTYDVTVLWTAWVWHKPGTNGGGDIMIHDGNGKRLFWGSARSSGASAQGSPGVNVFMNGIAVGSSRSTVRVTVLASQKKTLVLKYRPSLVHPSGADTSATRAAFKATVVDIKRVED